MEDFAYAFAEGSPYDVALVIDADTDVVAYTDTDGASEFAASGDLGRKRVVDVVVAAVELSFRL